MDESDWTWHFWYVNAVPDWRIKSSAHEILTSPMKFQSRELKAEGSGPGFLKVQNIFGTEILRVKTDGTIWRSRCKKRQLSTHFTKRFYRQNLSYIQGAIWSWFRQRHCFYSTSSCIIAVPLSYTHHNLAHLASISGIVFIIQQDRLEYWHVRL